MKLLLAVIYSPEMQGIVTLLNIAKEVPVCDLLGFSYSACCYRSWP
jgi:hypothetical protein